MSGARVIALLLAGGLASMPPAAAAKSADAAAQSDSAASLPGAHVPVGLYCTRGDASDTPPVTLAFAPPPPEIAPSNPETDSETVLGVAILRGLVRHPAAP